MWYPYVLVVFYSAFWTSIMSPSLRTTLPLDSELAMYRAGNDTEPALSVNHICGGNLIPIPTGFPMSGTHSFVYGHRVGNAGRYPPTLRVGAVGEVCTMAKDVTVSTRRPIA